MGYDLLRMISGNTYPDGKPLMTKYALHETP